MKELENQVRQLVKEGHVQLRDMFGNVITEGPIFEDQLKQFVIHLALRK